jgi:hypothetical protein
MGCEGVDWIQMFQDKAQLRDVNTVTNLRVPLKWGGGGFLDHLNDYELLKKDSVTWS